MAKVNFCPSCKTVLANEQVINGQCERCDSEVYQKELKQWFFKITHYAEPLLKGLEKLDWPQESKKRQKDWIGRSEGTVIKFEIRNSKSETNSKSQIQNHKQYIEVFTTRVDTLYGATYLVLAPEKFQELGFNPPASKIEKIQNYINQTMRKTALQRSDLQKEKKGVFTGLYAINPVNNEKIPVWIADYVLPDYGTGAIMCVPAHDERDFVFAKKYKLPIRQVIKNEKIKTKINQAFTEDGILINSAEFSQLTSSEARKKITKKLKKLNTGDFDVSYKLKDWLISRQRYWGAPIPIIYCEKCGEVSVPEKDLPIKLPKNVDFKPTGESPLARSEKFVNTKCPKCGGCAKRETDTMDTFVCSSWYYLRYLSPRLKNMPFDKQKVNKWLPVDLYVGGKEHVTMHLLYARFITKVLRDLKYINFNEPFVNLRHQGVITKNGAKMSKSKGNVVIPDEFIEKYGSDVLRLYLMAMGPYDEGGDWSDKGIVGMQRFLNKILNFVNSKQITNSKFEISKQLNKTIKKVTEDLENLKFNTAIACLIEWLNMALAQRSFSEVGSNNAQTTTKEMLETYIKLIAPFAPNFSQELWQKIGHRNSIFDEKWPEYDKKMVSEDIITIVIQVNGKVRDQIIAKPGDSEDQIKNIALKSNKIKKWISNKKIKRTIYIKNRLINIVI